MFNIEDAYLDIKAIEEGRWVPLGHDFPGVEVHVRGLSSPDAKALQMKLTREAPRAQRLSNGVLSDEAQEGILKKVIEEKCVLGWKGFAAGGKELPYNKKTLHSFLHEPKARKIGVAIISAITALELTTEKAAQEIEGN